MKLDIQLREADDFGRMLYEARVWRGAGTDKPLPMRKAAAILDTTEATYGTWEKGNVRPKLQGGDGLLQRLAFFTGQSELDLLVAMDVMTPPSSLGGRDSNPQPIDYKVTNHLHLVPETSEPRLRSV